MTPDQQIQAIGAMTPAEQCALFVEGSKPVSKSGGLKECACETSGQVIGTEFGEEGGSPGAEYGDGWWYFYTENSYKCMPTQERWYREAMMDILHVEEFANGNPSLHFKKMWFYSIALASAAQAVHDASHVPLDDPAAASQFECASRDNAVPELTDACQLAKQALLAHQDEAQEATECLETIRSLEFAQAAGIVDVKKVDVVGLVTETAKALSGGASNKSAANEKASKVFAKLAVLLEAVKPTVEANVPQF